MNTPLYNGDEVLALLPQRPPMVMVDRFYGIEDGVSRAGLLVQPENIFCADGHLQAAGLIEHVAQSAAARVGYLFSREGQPVPLGFIGSVEKFDIHSLPCEGCLITTSITIVQEVFDITLIAAEVHDEQQNLLAAGRMKIYLKK